MKFEEKLTELRRKNLLSQEELANVLNVTRQTVSKWELGQSKPDMDKLVEISKYFGVSIEVLANDEFDIKQFEENKTKPKKERKFLLYILILVLIAAVTMLAIRISIENEKDENEGKNTGIFAIFDNLFNVQDNSLEQFGNFASDIKNLYDQESQKMTEEHNQKVNDLKENSAKRTHNSQFEIYSGTKANIFVETVLDNIITNNKKNKEHMVILIYNNESISDEDRIKEIKRSLKDWSEYEISIDYDENGYVNKITLEDI